MTDATISQEPAVPIPEAANSGTGYHIVQVGYDDSVFDLRSGSDFVDRQSMYGRVLEDMVPGSRITNFILTQNSDAIEVRNGNTSFLPVVFRRRFQIPRLVRNEMFRLHAADPITIATTQTVQEDGIGALWFRRSTRVPVVGQIHFDLFSGAAQKENFGRVPWCWALKIAVFRTIHKYDALRVVGEGIRKALVAGKIHANVHLCPVAMPMVDRPATPASQPEHKVLFVGRLEAAKRLDIWLQTVVEIAKKDPKVTFEIVGDGSLKKPLQAQAESLGLHGRVKFLGATAYSELPKIYASAKVFLLTSGNEGFGRVAVEAMHYGLPVVATRITGLEDIVEDARTGFLSLPEDSKSLAEYVLKLLSDETLRTRMGEAARSYVDDKYGTTRLCREWMGILVSAGRTTQFPSPTFVKARRPTWRRWKALSDMRFSLLRGLQYEAIRGLRLEGKTLDIGGGARNSYYGLLEFAGEVENINIDPGISPTYLLDLNQPLPLPSNSYDNVLSLNTWEHIYRDHLAVGEAVRVLKPGGRFHFSIPFMYKAHGSPSDYHRHTAFWWHDYLVSLGIEPQNLRIEPLVWDTVSSALSLVDFQGKGWLRKLIMVKPLLSSRHGHAERVSHNWFDEFAVGYYITGTK